MPRGKYRVSNLTLHNIIAPVCYTFPADADEWLAKRS